MKHRRTVVIGVVLTCLVVAVVATALAGCARRSPALSSPSPTTADVTLKSLVFSYGVGSRNLLDTSRGTFTKDMIGASPITVPLALTGTELATISAKLDAIDFFSYPRVYRTRGEGGWAEPHETYRFAVTTTRGTKTVEWEDAVRNGDERAAGLRQLARLIERLIVAKPEYKRLPEPEGGYL